MYLTNFRGTLRHLAVVGFAAAFATGCLSGGGSESNSNSPAPPPPPGNAAPTISGNPDTNVVVGETYAFSPAATDTDNDPLTFSISNPPPWAQFSAATGSLTGQPGEADVGIYGGITISVSDGSASASLPSFAISVDQAGSFSTTLSWTAPTQNEDGTALTDLAGYRIYWGTTPGVYSDSVTVDNPGLTSYVVGNLSAGTYEFVATSFNEAGIESTYSNTATRTFQ